MSCEAGQTRSRSTGRCRKPCERHQAINPATGRCVSKNYLRKLQRECHGEDDALYAPYGTGSKKDYRVGLVPDPLCYPRKRNIYTGYCKTPCGTGRAINPATGNCVTLRYLRSLNPNDYDTDYDDESAAEILFTPTDLSYDNNVTNSVEGFKRFKGKTLTEMDLVILHAAYNVHTGLNLKHIVGAYSPDARKENCSEVAKSGFSDSNYSVCGLTDVSKVSKTGLSSNPSSIYSQVWDVVSKHAKLDENVFVFVTHAAKTLKLDLMHELGEMAKLHSVRVVVANFYGVWRILIPKVETESQSLGLTLTIDMIDEKMRQYDSNLGHINFRKLALDVHNVAKSRSDMHLSFAPYPEE